MTANGSDPKTQEHLEDHRAVILLRSALIGAATALPIPAVGDMLASALSRGLIYHVARLRYVDIDEAAVDELLTQSPKKQRMSVLSAVGGLISLVGRRIKLRRVFAGLAVLRGVEAGARAFHVATLFEHYCARHHSGLVIHAADARRLRDTIDEAMDTTQREMSSALFDQVATQGLQLLQIVPKWAWAQLTHGVAQPPLPALAAIAHEARTWLADVSVRRYLAHVVGSFDRQWNGGQGTSSHS